MADYIEFSPMTQYNRRCRTSILGEDLRPYRPLQREQHRQMMVRRVWWERVGWWVGLLGALEMALSPLVMCARCWLLTVVCRRVSRGLYTDYSEPASELVREVHLRQAEALLVL